MTKRNTHTSKGKNQSSVSRLLAVYVLTCQVILCTTVWAEISIKTTEDSTEIQVVPSGARQRITIDTPEDGDTVIMVGPGHSTPRTAPEPILIVPEIHVDHPYGQHLPRRSEHKRYKTNTRTMP